MPSSQERGKNLKLEPKCSRSSTTSSNRDAGLSWREQGDLQETKGTTHPGQNKGRVKSGLGKTQEYVLAFSKVIFIYRY